jgi:hypothetical protein
VPVRCLASVEMKSIAAGRRTEKELVLVRRHLAECARCRAALAARAAGVPGPGETVVLKRPRSAPPEAAADDQFDFGIDEPSPPRRTVRRRVIRTTLD